MVVIIKQLIWEPNNRKHIARHKVTQDEVEEVLRNFHIVKPTYQKRLMVLGETDTGRVLELVIVPKGKGSYYPLTCYDVNSDMRKLYKRKKGGES